MISSRAPQSWSSLEAKSGDICRVITGQWLTSLRLMTSRSKVSQYWRRSEQSQSVMQQLSPIQLHINHHCCCSALLRQKIPRRENTEHWTMCNVSTSLTFSEGIFRKVRCTLSLQVVDKEKVEDLLQTSFGLRGPWRINAEFIGQCFEVWASHD